MNEYLHESLTPSQEDILNKNNITKITSIEKSSNNDNIFVDVSGILYRTDMLYIDSLYNTCKNLNNFNNKIIYIPVSNILNDNETIDNSKTYLGAIYRYIKSNPIDLKKKFSNYCFIFYASNGDNFPLFVDKYNTNEINTVKNLLEILVSPRVTHYLRGDISKKSPVKDVKTKEEIKREDKEELELKKQELVDAIASAAETSDSEEEAIAKLENDEEVCKLIAELDEEDDGKPKLNAARTARIAKLNDEFLNKKVHGTTIKDIIDNKNSKKELESSHLKVSSINDDWEDMKFINFEKAYDINYDIMKILSSLSTKSYPVSIVDIKVEDTSNNMDYIYTYTINLEDGFGKRSTLVIDVPKFKNNRFMRLRGNEKVMSGQLLLLPCIKTDEDTVQCVSNYNKIFIRRKGSQGKSYPSSEKLIKFLRKLDKDDNSIKVYFGDNSSICSKYELPVDLIDIASQITKIETNDMLFLFNQDEYYTTYHANKSKGIPYAIDKKSGEIYYYIETESDQRMISQVIADHIVNDKNRELYDSVKPSSSLNYSEASILANKIPLVGMIAYSIGLSNTIKRITGKPVEIVDKRFNYDIDKYSIIKFNDGNIIYPINYSNSMLLNGLNAFSTENYSIADIDKKSMWLDFLDEYGGRILSDGLDNFADMFLDPITIEVCEHYKIPTDYFDMLIYANNLLADNKYNRHTDISGNRYRTNELVAGYFYKAIAKSYVDYKNQVKHGRKVGMTIKRSAVIDGIFLDPMCSDLSILNPLLEIEASNSVSFKGLSGMNSDRSYSLDKRTYDDSMINKLALSTGFAANVGINRQTTIDMDIQGMRGYIKNTNEDDMSVSKSFSMTEAVTPFGTTHDDPFRSAMTFIQTSKHSMRTKTSMPLLITNGADEAMPYISSNTFAYKAKGDGEVVEVTQEYMIIRYKNPIIDMDNNSYYTEYIDLKEEVKKNSDGGFFITIKLDTDLKVGSKFKKDDIIAYDKSSYSDRIGEDDNLAYNVGVLAKIAILNTDEGFEDSTAISSWLSEAMATDVVVESEKDLSKNTNVYNIVKVGQEVQEGDPLIIFQNSFDEKDANALLQNITDTDFVSDLGRIRIKSKYTGVIQDIKIYRTCEIDEMSDTLKKLVTEYERNIKRIKKIYDENGSPGKNLLPPDYKLEPTGIMKNNPDGVKIVFYIKYNDKLSVGDKVVAQSANKGVVKDIFPEGYEPFSEFRPEESIHALFAARSFNARMVTSVWLSGAINKCMIELDRKVKSIMGIEAKGLTDIEK